MIENVPQFCEQLMLERSTREDALVAGKAPTTTEDLLEDLGKDDFLDGNLEAVDAWLAGQEGTEYEQISVLEANGLLASAQNAYTFAMRDAFTRRFGRRAQEQLLYRERGVLDDQMKLVGTVVDPPVLLQLTEEQISGALAVAQQQADLANQ